MKSKSRKSFQVFIIVAACFILSMFFGCSNFLQDVMDNVSDIEVDYKVEHWKQSLDGKFYELDAQESQILQGTSLTKTQAQSKDFEGFISKKIEQQKIKRDGSTIVKIYYDRKSITYIFKAQGGNWNQDSSDQTKTGLYGAALDVPANPVKTGYTFSKWSSDVPETFGSSDITFVANWLPGTGTLYKVEYYLQNTDGSDYERIEDDSQNLVGTTGELTAAVAKEYEGFTIEEIEQKEIAPDGSTVVPVYYTRNSISYIFAANGGNWNGASDNKIVSGLYECSVTAPAAPVKTGYVFGGWSEEVPESFGTEPKSFSAVWLASTDTVYRVEHWQQNIDDDEYTKVDSDTQNLTGVTDAYTNAVSKLYSGFTVKSVAQKKIMPDGTTIVRIYYDRNEIVYTFAGEGGKWNNSVIVQTVEGRFGSEVVYPGQPERTGYNFLKWNSTVPSTFGVGNQTFSAEWVAKTDTIYKVEHWQQNIIDDGYTLVETDTKYGTTAAQTNALAKIYTGFTSQEVIQKKIAAEGNTIIRINYNRNIIDYTFNTAGGTFSDNLTSKIVSGKYGSTIITPESPNRVGYSFENWDNSIPTTFGENARTFTANWAARTDTIYKVEHWWQNINDDEYTKYTTESKQGTTAEQTVALAKSYEGFESQGVTQQEIAADGSTVIRINYNRKNITYTFNPNGGNWNNSTAVQIRSGKYGGAFSIPNPVRTGYTFSSWDKTVPSVFGTKNDTFTTNWNANTNTAYKVEHYQQNINDDGYTIVSNDTQNLTGTTATQTNAAAKYYLGFSVKSYNQSSIAPDGSTVVKIYYDRNVTTYTFNSGEGRFSDNSTDKEISGRYGATVSGPANPTRIGYTFNSWSGTVPATFGTENLSFTTSWTANTDTPYKVEHWKQNVSGSGYTVSTVQNLTGTTAAQTAARAQPVAGFTAKNFYQAVIAADGSTVIKIYYDRNTIYYTFIYAAGTVNGNTPVKTISGRYGSTVEAPPNPSRTGYSFDGWDHTVPSTFGASNIIFSPKWRVNTYTINFNANGGSGNMTSLSCNYDSSYTLSSNQFSRSTWAFNGWNTMSNGNGTNYSNGQTVSNLSSVNNGIVTLYAKWTYPEQLTHGDGTLGYICDYISLKYTVTISASKGNYSKTSTYNSGQSIPKMTFDDVPIAATQNGVTWTISVTATCNALGVSYIGSSSAKISNNSLSLTFPSLTKN